MKKEEKVLSSAVSRDTRLLDGPTGNLYETVAIIAKRANQISLQTKEEMHQKLEEFVGDNDNLEEVFENREQIEISRFYERIPKPNAIAVQEFQEDKVYYRNPNRELEA